MRAWSRPASGGRRSRPWPERDREPARLGVFSPRSSPRSELSLLAASAGRKHHDHDGGVRVSVPARGEGVARALDARGGGVLPVRGGRDGRQWGDDDGAGDRKSTRLNSSHSSISYAVFCLQKKKSLYTPLPYFTPDATHNPQYSHSPHL